MKNLMENVPANLDQELVTELICRKNVRIERIVSTGQASPADFWYDQDEHEWVLLLAGEAVLQLEDQTSVRLKPGDAIEIPAHQKHRVHWTSPNEPTVWLALFYVD